MFDLWDNYQQHLIRKTDQSVDRVDNRATRLEHRIEALERTVERLTLICRAQWNLLERGCDLKPQDLLDEIRSLDMLDGVEDGQTTGRLVTCPGCKREVTTKRPACLYCGEDISQVDPFGGT